jgi:hypothetical protein
VAWRNYFTNTLNWQENPAGSGIYTVPTTDTLIIKRYDIMVKSL